jgi:thioredoxin 1
MRLNELNDIVNNTSVVLVDYYADWCGPCKQMKPIINQIEAAYEGKLKVVRVDVDESADIAMHYTIMSIPTIHIFVNGGVVEGISGYRNREFIESILKGYV